MAELMDMDSDVPFTIDCLPLDCILCICEFLPVNDLGKFGRVCKLFYEASVSGYLWRPHCLSRWTFCDVQQVSPGPQQWRRYFLARRRVEASMERGRPGRDYKVKTLRGHEKDISAAYIINEGKMNWENPHPPLVVSLSQDCCLKAWDITQGKCLWSLEGQDITAVTGNNNTMEVATGGLNGSVDLFAYATWSKTLSFKTDLGGKILALKFVEFKSSKRVLLVCVEGLLGRENQIEVWQLPSFPDPATPSKEVSTSDSDSPSLLLQLWAPAHNYNNIKVSSSGLLAVPGYAGDVHIWDLHENILASAPTPLSPFITVNTQHTSNNLCWIFPAVLVTTEWTKINFWDIGTLLESQRKRASRATVNMYKATRELSCGSPITAMAKVNDKLVVGDVSGCVTVYEDSLKAQSPLLQQFSDHKGAITGVYADSFRVLTCSKDFSIRVYCWRKDGDRMNLESKYTLLGGSVANKTHDGFSKLLCEANSCVGVCGNQLKCYSFMSSPLVEQKILNMA